MDKYSRLELNANDIISDTQKTLHQWIFDAYKEAVNEGIKANTVLINKHFAKVNRHAFLFNKTVIDMPPMICGLEVRLSDELPEGYDFALCEAYETERDRLIRNAKAEIAREIFEEIDILGTYNPALYDELKKKYIGE